MNCFADDNDMYAIIAGWLQEQNMFDAWQTSPKLPVQWGEDVRVVSAAVVLLGQSMSAGVT